MIEIKKKKQQREDDEIVDIDFEEKDGDVNFLSKNRPEKPEIKISKKYKKTDNHKKTIAKDIQTQKKIQTPISVSESYSQDLIDDCVDDCQENSEVQDLSYSSESPDKIMEIEKDLKEQLSRLENYKKEMVKKVIDGKRMMEEKKQRQLLVEKENIEEKIEKKDITETSVDSFNNNPDEIIFFPKNKNEMTKKQVCPNCNSPLKKEKRFFLFTKKVKDIDGVLSQRFVCKNKSCGLVKEIRLKLK